MRENNHRGPSVGDQRKKEKKNGTIRRGEKSKESTTAPLNFTGIMGLPAPEGEGKHPAGPAVNQGKKLGSRGRTGHKPSTLLYTVMILS